MNIRIRFILFFAGSLFAFILFMGLFVALFQEFLTPYFFHEENTAYLSDMIGIFLPFIFEGLLFGQYFVNPLVTMLTLIKGLSEGDYHSSEINQKLYTAKGKLKARYYLYREMIADIDELTDKLEVAERERNQLEEAKTNWISGVFHDLKTHCLISRAILLC